MDKKEFSTLVMALKTYYPKENNLLPNNQAMELWYRELQDLSYTVAEMALRKWVSTNKWSPSISELRETATAVANGETPDWSDGWAEVNTAIRKYGSYGARQAMAGFSPITYETVKRLGWMNLCMSENQTADRANFRQTFETFAHRDQLRKQLPMALQETILSIQHDDGFKLGGGENESQIE